MFFHISFQHDSSFFLFFLVLKPLIPAISVCISAVMSHFEGHLKSKLGQHAMILYPSVMLKPVVVTMVEKADKM